MADPDDPRPARLVRGQALRPPQTARSTSCSFRELVMRRFDADLKAWRENGWPIGRSRAGIARAIVQQNGLRATLFYRIAHWAHTRHIPVAPILLHQISVALHGIELPPNVPAGPGLYVPHTVGSVVFAERIGAGVTLQGGITIGLRDRQQFPVIDDGVFLAAGCRVLGPVHIGAGARIGANAVVLKDIPAGATAVGVPARILEPGPAEASQQGV